MKVSFSEITEGGIRRVIKDTGWSSGSGLGFNKTPEADIVLQQRDSRTVSLEGKMQAKVKSVCGRCGAALDLEVDETFNYLFRLGEDCSHLQEEIEISADEDETVFLEEPEINIDEVLLEQLLLSVPIRLLCHEDCRGLCPTCGISLNDEQCDCEKERSNSPFAVLRHLKK